MNQAPAVIIRPEHQSAPKTPVMSPEQFRVTDRRRVRPDDDGLEAGPCYVSTDPLVNKQQRAMHQQSLLEERLNPVEEALRQYERSAAAVRQYRWRGQERWQGRQNEETRLTRILHAHRFIWHLQQAGVDARLGAPSPNVPSTARLWLNDFVRLGRVGITAWCAPDAYDRENHEDRKVARTVTSVQYPYGPEYSVMRFDDHNLPTNEKYRGWRTALLALIVGDIITEAEAERAFGPALGEASDFYREQLYIHRRVRAGLDRY